MSATTEAKRLAVKDLPEGYEVVRQKYEVECQHPACATMHCHLFNTDHPGGPILTDLYSMSGEYVGNRWDQRFHMAQRVEWVILLNGQRVGDAHDRKRDALAEAVTKPTI